MIKPIERVGIYLTLDICGDFCCSDSMISDSTEKCAFSGIYKGEWPWLQTIVNKIKRKEIIPVES